MKKVLLGSLLCMLSSTVLAAPTGATVETVANTIITEIDQLPNLLSAISYICGIGFGVKSLLKFKEHNESKGQVKLVVPIVLIVASACCLSLPTLMKVGIETVGYDTTAKKNFKYKY